MNIPAASSTALSTERRGVRLGDAWRHPGWHPGSTDAGTGGRCLPVLLAELKLLQMATASREATAKTEEFTAEIMERKKSISHVPILSFQLKENLLPSDQMNGSAEADGENHSSGAPLIKN